MVTARRVSWGCVVCPRFSIRAAPHAACNCIASLSRLGTARALAAWRKVDLRGRVVQLSMKQTSLGMITKPHLADLCNTNSEPSENWFIQRAARTAGPTALATALRKKNPHSVRPVVSADTAESRRPPIPRRLLG